MVSESHELKDPEKGSLDILQFAEPKKRKYPGFRKNLYNYFSEFSANTGIHGFKYMGAQERPLVEKLYWLVLFGISLCVCISLMKQTWIKWNTSVLVSFAQNPTPIWRVPFPAVTICPETKARQRAYNFTESYNKILHHLILNETILTAEELQKFSYVSLLCDNHLNILGNKTVGFDAVDYLIDLAPPFSEVLLICKWATNLNETCDSLFSPMLTEDGICFTFNMLARSFTKSFYQHGGDFLKDDKSSEGWTLEGGYSKSAGRDIIPRRVMSAGSKAGLFLLLRAYEQDLDYTCRGPFQGFKILLHHPAEVPRVETQYIRAPLNQEMVVRVKPDMITTSPGLENYDPHRRQCFFAKERQLRFYQTYTQQNCQVECVANYTLERCGCVAFHMPHDENTKICGTRSNDCILEAEQELLAREVETGVSRLDSGSFEESTQDCDCLPSCTSITYNAETSSVPADFNWQQHFGAYNANLNEFPGMRITRIYIFFKETQFVTSERNELYSPKDFLANCGGLLGLFTGFSTLTIVEIIYFLSIRLICNVRKYSVHFWSGSENLLNNERCLLHS